MVINRYGKYIQTVNNYENDSIDAKYIVYDEKSKAPLDYVKYNDPLTGDCIYLPNHEYLTKINELYGEDRINNLLQKYVNNYATSTLKNVKYIEDTLPFVSSLARALISNSLNLILSKEGVFLRGSYISEEFRCPSAYGITNVMVQLSTNFFIQNVTFETYPDSVTIDIKIPYEANGCGDVNIIDIDDDNSVFFELNDFSSLQEYGDYKSVLSSIKKTLKMPVDNYTLPINLIKKMPPVRDKFINNLVNDINVIVARSEGVSFHTEGIDLYEYVNNNYIDDIVDTDARDLSKKIINKIYKDLKVYAN